MRPSWYMLVFDKNKPIGYYAARTKEQLVYELKRLERIKGYKLTVVFHERGKK